MRWNEIVNEDLSVVQLAKSYIMDILAPLQAQQVQSITVQQICDQLAENPDLGGTQIQPDLVTTALKDVDSVSIEPNDQGELSVFLKQPGPDTASKKNQEKDDKAVHNAAMRTVNANDSEDGSGL